MSDEKKSQLNAKLDAISERIAQLRDELEVQLHLGAAEARDEWEQLEATLGPFKEKVENVADAAEDAAEGVLEAASLAGEELVQGYQRIRSLISKKP